MKRKKQYERGVSVGFKEEYVTRREKRRKMWDVMVMLICDISCVGGMEDDGSLSLSHSSNLLPFFFFLINLIYETLAIKRANWQQLSYFPSKVIADSLYFLPCSAFLPTTYIHVHLLSYHNPILFCSVLFCCLCPSLPFFHSNTPHFLHKTPFKQDHLSFPLMEIQQQPIMSRFRRICVYCGSSPGKNPSYQLAAVQLGKQLASINIFP